MSAPLSLAARRGELAVEEDRKQAERERGKPVAAADQERADVDCEPARSQLIQGGKSKQHSERHCYSITGSAMASRPGGTYRPCDGNASSCALRMCTELDTTLQISGLRKLKLTKFAPISGLPEIGFMPAQAG
jgi:hypothetical protein